MAELPSGTVTFLFTDLEGSTRLWEQHPVPMRPALARHDAILRNAVTAHGGDIVKTTGDGIFAVFATAHEALDAAAGAQVELQREPWDAAVQLRVRMGLHSCEAELRDGDYFGSEVNRAARLMSVAHGGQVVVSAATSALLRDTDVELVDLGEHRLRDLSTVERVFQVSAPGLVKEFPPLRSLDLLPGNLPRQVTTFVGRESQLASVADLVVGSSLVTLTGVGGVGKTRLALQVAAELIGEFRDGAWLCEFASVTDPGAVWETLAASLRVQAFPGRSVEELVLEYLAEKRLLLVLDNCEHLLDAVAHQVDMITQRCARVSVLATSREGLALGGERIVAVPSLGVPTGNAADEEVLTAEAVQLFGDRARAARNDFVLTGRNAGAVAVLCRRLDGIPLAIELAAARVRSMAPEDLVARLDQRFKLLTRGSRAALERHQTLRSTIDWSYDLLNPIERQALNRLSVFAGGCDLAAAEAVLADEDLDVFDADDVLGQLVDKSLVVADNDDSGGARYRLLETIRQYGQEQLQTSGETVAIRRRHADYYVEFAETAGPHLRGPEMLEWTNIVARDIDNFRAAFDWAVETPSPEHALRLVAPLAVEGKIGYAALDWAATASTIPGGDNHPLVPVVAAWAAWGATMAVDFKRAEELVAVAERSEAALGVRLGSVARGRATLAFYRGEFEQARHHAEDWVELARASSDRYELAHALVMLAAALQLTETTIDAAITTVEEAVRVARAAGVDTALGMGLAFLAGWLPIEDSERALALVDEAIEAGTRIGDPMAVGAAREGKVHVAAQRGEWRTALAEYVDAVEQYMRAFGSLTNPAGFYMAAIAFGALRHFEPAAVLIGWSDARMPERIGPGWALEMLATTEATIIEVLGEQRVARLAEQGAALEASALVAYLRAEANQALAAP